MTDAGLEEKEARSRFYLVDRQGLLVEGMKGLQPFQAIFAQSRERIAAWNLSSAGQIGLAEVVANAHPTVLIGTSGQAHAFIEPVLRTMAAGTRRPIIFPLSNPTERSEATPEDLLAWTEDRAIIGTGSPFPAVIRKGRPFRIDQINNAYSLSRCRFGRDRHQGASHIGSNVSCRSKDDCLLVSCQARSARQFAAAARRKYERSRFRWRLLWRSRQEAKGLHVLSRRTTSPQMSNR